MKTFITSDGERLAVTSSRDLVRKLRKETWTGPTRSKTEWMHDVAQRARQSTGKPVRTDTDAHFVNDLIQTELIREQE